MTSKLISRVLDTNITSRSIYEALSQHEEGSPSDVEMNVGFNIDEENLGLQNHELADVDIFNEDDSHVAVESTGFLSQQDNPLQKLDEDTRTGHVNRSKWDQQIPRLQTEDGDDDVPASLLIEGHDIPGPRTPKTTRKSQPKSFQKALPKPGILNGKSTVPLNDTYSQLNPQFFDRNNIRNPLKSPRITAAFLRNSREKALWRWANVTNLDNFIREVYDYYTGSGIQCILLESFLNLFQVVFVAAFTTFLTQCVDFPQIPTSRNLSEVLVPQCTKKIAGFSNLAIWLFTLHVFWRIYQLLADIPRLLRIRDFYSHLLEIPESDMQTVSWQDVVARIMALRDANPITAEMISSSNRKFLGSQSKQRLDAHDIANRLMRRENYLIALFNKDILDLTLPVPFLQGRQLFSRALLWNIDQCIMDLVFNEHGQVRQLVLKDSHRKQLSNALRGRFLFAGVMNACFAPIIVVYLMIVYFLRYFNEYQKNPAAVGSRQYTPLAVWKFREFNELQHLFDKRLNMSYPFASRYLDQFPKVKMAHFARSASFFSGAIVSVLAVITLWDPEMLTNFEITTDRPVVFYIGVFGAIWALTKGMIPEENLVFEPEYALRNVIDYIHYMPNHWQNRLHCDDVKREFATLYQLKIVIFFQEVFSIIVTPFILWFSLPKCSEQIIDFFREFTVHVDGVGYVCSFAVFNFKKSDGRKAPYLASNTDYRDDYYSTKHGKMAASYYGFIDNYLINPKTAIQGHVPPGMQNYPRGPTLPGLVSPLFSPETQTHRTIRNKQRLGIRNSKLLAKIPHTISPLQSILLDPHHQPSNSGFDESSSRSRHVAEQNIVEENTEDEDVLDFESRRKHKMTKSYQSYQGLDESRWEMSPTRATVAENEESDERATGVLGLLYKFQKAQNDGRGGVEI
ncbi:unnamed protein product [Blumeria hordei]|uniref:Autophagy-related protein 9 n=1 Tax=Blumeria hordei TaxID=2867405 RepID=A0A383UUZ8_BLUHO|nr:unnamed protein product [Blumeria hordei]